MAGTLSNKLVFRKAVDGVTVLCVSPWAIMDRICCRPDRKRHADEPRALEQLW